jgi:predicted Zn-dependent protease with MMP-like domain
MRKGAIAGRIHPMSRFDQLVEKAIVELPLEFRDFLRTIPVIVQDEATPEMLREAGYEEEDELFGLFVGDFETEKSLTNPASLEPERIYLFRGPLEREADGDPEILESEIRITLLHEVGHHFGLDEDDLARLGYD